MNFFEPMVCDLRSLIDTHLHNRGVYIISKGPLKNSTQIPIINIDYYRSRLDNRIEQIVLFNVINIQNVAMCGFRTFNLNQLQCLKCPEERFLHF